ncbi:BON domain-containing protein [Paraburkholderia sp. J76]|uniref:BON domain-containing protein n=1 Tax=Paraburkholderia sp. J76 TaxID=2805439 RepID=UPI002ABE60A3|nr:BON domain-containing protein [Paraburkholderia sp. J76]
MNPLRCALRASHAHQRHLPGSLAGLCFVLAAQAAFAQSGSQGASAVPPPNQLPPHNLAAGNPGYGGEASDTLITAHAKAALMATDGVTSGDVHVTTQRGAVTLTGTVPDEAQRDKAENVVHDLDGVVSVTNNLKVGKPQ